MRSLKPFHIVSSVFYENSETFHNLMQALNRNILICSNKVFFFIVRLSFQIFSGEIDEIDERCNVVATCNHFANSSSSDAVTILAYHS